jgi:phenylacetate-CoA ligase
VRTVMVSTSAVAEYQVRQTEQGIHADVVADPALDLGALATALERSLRQAGLAGATVSLRLVDRIERHPDTGKVRRFISL